MRPLVHSALVVVALLVAGCAASVSLDDPVIATGPSPVPAETATPESQPTTSTVTPTPDPAASAGASPTEPPTTPTPDATTAAASTPAPTGVPTPTPDVTPASTPTAVPAATPTPTSTTPVIAIPTPTPTPVAIEFVIAPDAPLLGVALGTRADDALAALTALIGPPDFDSDWRVGCPLDGEDLDERLVQWGDLNVYFDRSEGDELFVTWGYDLRIVEGGYPELELIQLPGGGRMGQPIEDVAAAAALSVEYDELFDVNRVSEPGFEIVADGAVGSPVWGAFVPSIPLCE